MVIDDPLPTCPTGDITAREVAEEEVSSTIECLLAEVDVSTLSSAYCDILAMDKASVIPNEELKPGMAAYGNLAEAAQEAGVDLVPSRSDDDFAADAAENLIVREVNEELFAVSDGTGHPEAFDAEVMIRGREPLAGRAEELGEASQVTIHNDFPEVSDGAPATSFGKEDAVADADRSVPAVTIAIAEAAFDSMDLVAELPVLEAAPVAGEGDNESIPADEEKGADVSREPSADVTVDTPIYVEGEMFMAPAASETVATEAPGSAARESKVDKAAPTTEGECREELTTNDLFTEAVVEVRSNTSTAGTRNCFCIVPGIGFYRELTISWFTFASRNGRENCTCLLGSVNQ